MKLSASRVSDEPEISLVPLIDVVLTLIVFFVLTTTFAERSALKLQLPEASAQPASAGGDPLLLVVDQQGRYFVGGNEVLKRDVNSLRESIAQVAGEDRERPIILRADARAPYQAVVTGMDALGQLGFSKISLATATPTGSPRTAPADAANDQ